MAKSKNAKSFDCRSIAWGRTGGQARARWDVEVTATLSLFLPVLVFASANLIQFGRIIDHLTRRHALSYNGYGCYCGWGGSRQPVDATDWYGGALGGGDDPGGALTSPEPPPTHFSEDPKHAGTSTRLGSFSPIRWIASSPRFTTVHLVTVGSHGINIQMLGN